MAAFAVETAAFTKLFNALLKSDGGFLAGLNNTALVPNAARSGAITARITTAVTLTTITDGTMASNAAARTEVDLTPFQGQHVISLFPYETAQFTADSDAMEREVSATVSAARVLGETTVLADLVAGSPGATQTLPDGQLDFTTDGTDAEAYLALDKLDQALTYVEANTAGGNGRISILTTVTGFGKLITLRQTSRGKTDFDRENGQWMYRGWPIYPTTVTTNFGTATKAAAFVVHHDAEALVFNELFIPQAEFKLGDDGMQKLFLQVFGFAGLIQATHYAEVVNGAS